MIHPRRIAYFSMEIGLLPSLPTYSGGLGLLAGDTIRSAADLGLPMVGMTLLHRKGCFYQRLGASRWQTEEAVNWQVDDFLSDTGSRESVVTRTTQSLEDKLEKAVVPLFHANHPAFIEVMRHAIALNDSFFNTLRMVAQYAAKASLAWPRVVRSR